jgi:hypothetical protein
MFHELPGKAALELADRPLLWAGTDGRARHRLRPRVLRVLCQAYARPRVVSGAWDAVDFRNVGVGRCRRESLRRVRHHEGCAHRGEGVLLLTGIACGEGDGMRWMRDDCDGWSDGDRERETAGKDQAAGCDRGSRHSQHSTTLGAVCRDSPRSLRNVSAAQTKKAGAHCCAPASIRLSVYGLELTDECGTAIGPSDCSSSDSPMHWPELPPVHGMLSTSGSPPGDVWPASGEFGTRSGVHSPVKVSSDSPAGHAAIVGAELTGPAKTATAGATATATANPPARISRRAGSIMVAVVTLSVVVDRSRDSNCRYPPSHLLAEHYADYLENAAPSSIKVVHVSHF